MNIKINRNTLFLTELVIDLFVFAACAAVCVALLAQANVMMRQSTKLTEAVYIAQTIASRGADEGRYSFNADGTDSSGESEYAAVCTKDGDTVEIVVLDKDNKPVYTLFAPATEVRG